MAILSGDASTHAFMVMLLHMHVTFNTLYLVKSCDVKSMSISRFDDMSQLAKKRASVTSAWQAPWHRHDGRMPNQRGVMLLYLYMLSWACLSDHTFLHMPFRPSLGGPLCSLHYYSRAQL